MVFYALNTNAAVVCAPPHRQMTKSLWIHEQDPMGAVTVPTQLVSGAVVLQAEAVGLPHPLLPSPVLLVGAGWDDGLPPPLPAQRVGARAEEQGEAVLLRHAFQEAAQGSVAFLPVAAAVGGRRPLGAGHHVIGPQGAAFLVQAAVLSRLQTLVLAVQRKRGSWRSSRGKAM